jgi:hypothetical protein
VACPAPDFGVFVLEEPPDNVVFAEVFRFADGKRIEVDVPEPVAAFVRRFDKGDFVDLDRHGWLAGAR